MSTPDIAQPIKKLSGWGIAFAILLILVGFLALALPLEAGFGVTIVVGWLIFFSGIFHIAHAFHTKGAGPFVWRLLVGIVYIIGGLAIAFRPAIGLVTLTLVLGVILIVEGVLGIVAFTRHRKLPGSGWILIDGIVSLLLGLIIWWDGPRAAVWVIGTLVGINLIFSGITRLMFWGATRRAVSLFPLGPKI